jgi:hypothetical protein
MAASHHKQEHSLFQPTHLYRHLYRKRVKLKYAGYFKVHLGFSPTELIKHLYSKGKLGNTNIILIHS